MINSKILPREFYNNDTVKVAKNLLGKNLVRVIGKKILSGIITEEVKPLRILDFNDDILDEK